jgi:hypothetical protein
MHGELCTRDCFELTRRADMIPMAVGNYNQLHLLRMVLPLLGAPASTAMTPSDFNT